MIRMIPDNQITLLQNGEESFPAIEAAMDRAEHEVYLESYIFKNDDMDMPDQTLPRYDYAVSVEGSLVDKNYHSTRRVWLRVAWIRFRAYWGRGVGRHTSSTESVGGGMCSAFLVRDNIRHRRDIEDDYLQTIENAQFEIILANAFFLPVLNFRHTLPDTAGLGLRVILLLKGSAQYRLLHFVSLFYYAGEIKDGKFKKHATAPVSSFA